MKTTITFKVFKSAVKILLIFLLQVTNGFAQDVFNLKGKDIILMSDEYSTTVGALYYESVLYDLKFNKKKLYPDNILGSQVYIEDVFLINKGNKKKEAVVIVMNNGIESLALHLPLQYKIVKQSNGFRITKKYAFESFFSGTQKGVSSYSTVTYKVEIDDINIKHFDLHVLDSIELKHYNEIFYFRHSLDPYVFNGFKFDDNVSRLDVEYKGIKEDFIRSIRLRPEATFAKRGIEQGNYLSGFMSSVIWEKELMAIAESKSDSIFINKLKQKYIGKEIHKRGNINLGWHTIINIQNGKDDSNQFKGFYNCVDIRLIKSNRLEHKYFYCAILEDISTGEKYAIQIKEDFDNIFVLADDYRKQEAERIREEYRIEAERKSLIAKEEAAYEARLVRKYGKKNAQLILNSDVVLGFTKEMCIESWGEPLDINRTITRNSKSEQWVYGIGMYLYFEGNILTGIQD